MRKQKYQLAYKSTKLDKRVVILCLMIVLLGLSLFTLSFLNPNQSTGLVGTWESDETGQVIAFTKENTVDFSDDLPSGTYRIISPNSLEYTIKGMTFKMIYYTEEGKLYWGMNKENLECFAKK